MPPTQGFCANSVNSGGAGNVNYARPNVAHGEPNPHPPTPANAYNGYADSAGSLCIKKMNILGSKTDPSANGDLQVQFNLTSDSDVIHGHQ